MHATRGGTRADQQRQLRWAQAARRACARGGKGGSGDRGLVWRFMENGRARRPMEETATADASPRTIGIGDVAGGVKHTDSWITTVNGWQELTLRELNQTPGHLRQAPPPRGHAPLHTQSRRRSCACRPRSSVPQTRGSAGWHSCGAHLPTRRGAAHAYRRSGSTWVRCVGSHLPPRAGPVLLHNLGREVQPWSLFHVQPNELRCSAPSAAARQRPSTARTRARPPRPPRVTQNSSTVAAPHSSKPGWLCTTERTWSG